VEQKWVFRNRKTAMKLLQKPGSYHNTMYESFESLSRKRRIVRVLVTGAAGFIGFHVAKRLVDEGHHVVGLDNFFPYYSVQLKKDRASVLKEAGVTVVDQNVEEIEPLKALIAKENISHIVHLAAQAGVRFSLQEPTTYLKSNIDGFLSVLEAVRSHPEIIAVWASSSSVYGSNRKLPFSEDDRTDSPTNLYGATKKANEVMAQAYHYLFGLSLIGLRFFTVYGPWGRPDMAYFLFADKMMRGETIDLFGGGQLRRDFTYIDDIVDGIIAALSCPKKFGLYNLGNHQSESVDSLVSCLETSLGHPAKVRKIDRPIEDMVETCADIRRASEDLGFSPKVSLAEGIDRFASWYLSYIHLN
jgi:UDP-glucuronate 4-epimerase